MVSQDGCPSGSLISHEELSLSQFSHLQKIISLKQKKVPYQINRTLLEFDFPFFSQLLLICCVSQIHRDMEDLSLDCKHCLNNSPLDLCLLASSGLGGQACRWILKDRRPAPLPYTWVSFFHLVFPTGVACNPCFQ